MPKEKIGGREKSSLRGFQIRERPKLRKGKYKTVNKFDSNVIGLSEFNEAYVGGSSFGKDQYFDKDKDKLIEDTFQTDVFVFYNAKTGEAQYIIDSDRKGRFAKKAKYLVMRKDHESGAIAIDKYARDGDYIGTLVYKIDEQIDIDIAKLKDNDQVILSPAQYDLLDKFNLTKSDGELSNSFDASELRVLGKAWNIKPKGKLKNERLWMVRQIRAKLEEDETTDKK